MAVGGRSQACNLEPHKFILMKMTDTNTTSSNSKTIEPTSSGVAVEIQFNRSTQGVGADATIEDDANTIEVIKDVIDRETPLDNDDLALYDVKAKCFGGFGDLKMAKGYNIVREIVTSFLRTVLTK